jgi:hypothetical protein
MTHLITSTPLGLVVQWSSTWSRRSHDQARRNAMAACTDLAELRRERLEAEEFVAICLARRRARLGREMALG